MVGSWAVKLDQKRVVLKADYSAEMLDKQTVKQTETSLTVHTTMV